MAAVLPANLALVVKRLQNFTRQTIRVRAMTSDRATAQQTINWRLPSNTLIDLHNLTMLVDCEVTATGNTYSAFDVAIGLTTGTGAKLATATGLSADGVKAQFGVGADGKPGQRKRVFLQLPVGAQTMIERCDVICNGVQVNAHCGDLGYLYNILQYHLGHIKKVDEPGGGSYNHGWLTHQYISPEEKLLMDYRVVNPAGGFTAAEVAKLKPTNTNADNAFKVTGEGYVIRGPSLSRSFNATVNTSTATPPVTTVIYESTPGGLYSAPLMKRPNDDGVGNGWWLYADETSGSGTSADALETALGIRSRRTAHGPTYGGTAVRKDTADPDNPAYKTGKEIRTKMFSQGVYSTAELPTYKPFVYLSHFTKRPLLFDNWLGFLGGDYVRFLDTAVTGPIEIRMRLAGRQCLAMNEFRWKNYYVSYPNNSSADNLNWPLNTNITEYNGLAGTRPWTLDPDWTYTFSNMYMIFDTIGFADDFYRQILARRLIDGGTITIPFRNIYETRKLLSGSTDTVQVQVATQSLDYIVSTLRYSSYTNETRPHHMPPGFYNTWPYFSAVSGVGKETSTAWDSPVTWQYIVGNQLYPNWPAKVHECEVNLRAALDICGDLGGVCSVPTQQDFYHKLFAFVYCFKPHTEAEKIISGMDTRGASSNMYTLISNLPVEKATSGAEDLFDELSDAFLEYDLNGNMVRKHVCFTYVLMTSTLEVGPGQNVTRIQ